MPREVLKQIDDPFEVVAMDLNRESPTISTANQQPTVASRMFGTLRGY
jgi:hypothetical protein